MRKSNQLTWLKKPNGLWEARVPAGRFLVRHLEFLTWGLFYESEDGLPSPLAYAPTRRGAQRGAKAYLNGLG